MGWGEESENQKSSFRNYRDHSTHIYHSAITPRFLSGAFNTNRFLSPRFYNQYPSFHQRALLHIKQGNDADAVRKAQFALVDAIETKCLDGVSEEAFKQKISEKLGDASLTFKAPGAFKHSGSEPSAQLTSFLRMKRYQQTADRSEAHIDVLQDIRNWWPEIDQCDNKVLHSLNSTDWDN